jgi:hypothetical protein
MANLDEVARKTEAAGGNPEFCSHMVGIAKKFNLDWDSSIDHILLPKVVDSYEGYTKQRYGGENLHSGKTIHFSQFVKSALEHYH